MSDNDNRDFVNLDGSPAVFPPGRTTDARLRTVRIKSNKHPSGVALINAPTAIRAFTSWPSRSSSHERCRRAAAPAGRARRHPARASRSARAPRRQARRLPGGRRLLPICGISGPSSRRWSPPIACCSRFIRDDQA